MKKILWVVVVVGLAAALAAVRAERVHQKEDAPTLAPAAPIVRVVPARQGRVAETRHVLGTVVGADEVEVAPRVMAQVLSVRVREGARVSRGEVLATLDGRELEDGVAKAEAALQAARENQAAARIAFDVQRDVTARDKVLLDGKAIAVEQWERSTAARAAASARLEAATGQTEIAARSLEQARTRLGYARLTAPFDGVVAARHADPGALALPGRPLLTLVRQGSVRVRASLAADDFAVLAVGHRVTLARGDATVEAAVSRVFPAMGAAHLAAFEADVARPPLDFVSGATVGVDVEVAAAGGVIVPTDALLEGDRGTFVVKVGGGLAHPVRVDAVASSMDETVVRGDVGPGDLIVVAQPSRLMTLGDGTAVRTEDR